jgi:hypothetical protein
MFRLLKLKPPHGWDAVAWELVIVTAGVLLALAAQQVVETANHRGEARDAERDIRGELEQNMAKLRSRWAIRACVEKRVAELQELIGSSGARGGAIETPNWVGRPQFWTMQMGRWQATSQAGRAALLRPDDLALYSSMYSYMGNVTAAMIKEQDDWARLRSLEHLDRLSPEMAFQLLSTLQEARYINWRMGVWTIQLGTLSDRLHLKTVRNDIPASRSACVPMSTPREQAVRQTNSAYQGEP